MAGILLLVVVRLVNSNSSFGSIAVPLFLFSQVYMDVLSTEDLLFIVSTLYPSIEHSVLLKMITYNAKVCAYKC